MSKNKSVQKLTLCLHRVPRIRLLIPELLTNWRLINSCSPLMTTTWALIPQLHQGLLNDVSLGPLCLLRAPSSAIKCALQAAGKHGPGVGNAEGGFSTSFTLNMQTRVPGYLARLLQCVGWSSLLPRYGRWLKRIITFYEDCQRFLYNEDAFTIYTIRDIWQNGTNPRSFSNPCGELQ